MRALLVALLLVAFNLTAQTRQEGVEVQKSRLLLLPASTVENSAGGSGQPPQSLSTHPSHQSRIRDIEANLPRVLPLYGRQPR